MAVIGQSLPAPEVGWRRYDEQESMVTTTGEITKGLDNTIYYNGTNTWLKQNQYIKFSFIGTKIRLISRTASSYSSNVQIKLDATEDSFSTVTTTTTNMSLVYEKTGLTNTRHTVTITNLSTGNVWFDAIDIDENGVFGTTNKILIQSSDGSYRGWDEGISWKLVTVSNPPTEQDYIDNGIENSVLSSIPQSAWQELTGTVELCYFTDDTSLTEAQFNIETTPFTLAEEFEGKQVKILEYTDNPSQTESVVETETEPYSIYDEFGDTMEVLYYTDDPDKIAVAGKSELEITANYSPLDELDGDFEVVTWTDTLEEAVETLSPTITNDVIEDGSVYATELDLTDVIKIK